MSIVFAGLAVVAAAIVAAFAIVAARVAFLAWRSQSHELSGLKGERAKEVEEKHWARARRVYIDLKEFAGVRGNSDTYVLARPPAITATMYNVSDRPVYDVRIHWVDLRNAAQSGAEDHLGTVGPGGQAEKERAVPEGVAGEEFMPVGYFRDSAGNRWTVTPNGYLDPVAAELRVGAPTIATRAAVKEAERLHLLRKSDAGE